MLSRVKAAAAALCVAGLLSGGALADETCQSPYMPKITGVEEYVYVWTLGMEGVGDGQDKLVTIDNRKDSPNYGKVIASHSTGSRGEAHHGGLTDDRSQFWVGGLDDSLIHIFDIKSDPARPELVETITDFVEKSGGVVGPHGFYALPGRMLISALSNKDKTGETALVEYTNDGNYITTHWIPGPRNPDPNVQNAEKADGYGYDARVLPRRNIMLTSSFTGHENYMRPLGELMGDKQAMTKFGSTMVVWKLHERKPIKVLEVPGVPLEIRFAWGANNNYAFTSTALTSQIVLIHEDENGEWQAKPVADIGDPKKLPVPVDISLSSDDKRLWVDTFMDGTTRLYDVSDPFKPKLVYEKVIGKQVNMVSQSWDGKRLYFTTSLLANWDKTGDDNDQFLKAYDWDGKELRLRYEIDFKEQKLGRPHLMRFGSASLY